MRVPLDHGAPGGERVELAVIRLPARGGQRIGSLVLNPGGPGSSGVEYARAARIVVSEEIRERFDVVGFDPRGVGGSAPVECLGDEELDTFFSLDASPDSAAERTDLETGARRFAEGCRRGAGRLLPYLGTVDVARDLELLRQALGDQKLTYLGKSYGTFLGAVYADMFPGRVRALVLDGALDPAASRARLNSDQAVGFEEALRAYAAECLREAGCPFRSRDVDGAVAEVGRLLRRTDERPLPGDGRRPDGRPSPGSGRRTDGRPSPGSGRRTDGRPSPGSGRRTDGRPSPGDGRHRDGRPLPGGGREVTQALATLGLLTPLYDRELWPELTETLRQAFHGDGRMLLHNADQLIGRDEDGTYSNQSEANMAINCVDGTHPADYEREAAASSARAPRFGPSIMWSSLPCAYWPAPATFDSHPLTAHGAPPILVLGTRRDPATPYRWARALAGELESGVLLGFEGDGHTAYFNGSPCVDGAVERYLVTGAAPEDGTVCPGIG
ncbi:TAP-like protein [Nonomuraea solani]|uniref:TAP-like protein n=1 Tax=Nonomuraea solani TaxID=1144553 RepID=A0A1H6D5P8_9ACTN|nr:TAP-like protein [Nonomuraea solani]